MRQLVDQQVVTDTGGEWHGVRPAHELKTAMPQSVRALIERTANRLDERDRRILVGASVQGFAFDSAVVARALQLEPEDVEERLERIERIHGIIRLIEERELSGHTPSLRYAFRHHYYHNVFHDSVRGTRRQTMSAATAATMREYYGSAGAMASELAVLYEAARDFTQAAAYYLAAAQHAASVFANKETVVLARRGLDVLAAMAPSQDRDRVELQLQAAFGFASTAVRGYAAPEVEHAYVRARELCDRLGDSAGRFGALFGIYRYYQVRGRLEAACDIGRQLLSLVAHGAEPLQTLIAHNTMGPPLIHLGAYPEALEHLSAVSSTYKPEHRHASRMAYGTDIGMTCLLWRAVALWLLGRSDEAAETHSSALATAMQDPVPFELGYAHCMTAWLQQFRCDVAGVQEHAELAIKIAREHDFAMWLAVGTMFRSWALAASGHTAEGVTGLQEGIEGFQRTGAELNMPYYMALLADAYRMAGELELGLATVKGAFRYADTNGDRCWEPEILRLRGELLAAGDLVDAESAEQSFRDAVTTASRQNSLSLGVRAAVGFARLLAHHHRHEDARMLLCNQMECVSHLADLVDVLQKALKDLELR